MRENGYETDEDELIKELLRDRRWYELSGGGVTISGGEPMLQPMAVRSLSSKLRAAGIHVAVDTALCVPWEIVKILLDTTDLFLVDLKTIDASAHEKYTSRTNTDILKNIQRFPETSQIRIRIPVIGDVNDSDRDRERFLKLILGLGKKITAVDLLKYHNIGISKAARYGIEQPQFNAPTEDRMNAFLKAFGECSLHAHIG
jgi:pyruvate formate lyase activating enzyme